MSFKAMTLAASMLAASVSASLAGNTSALDIKADSPPITSTKMAAPMTSSAKNTTNVRSEKLDKILRDCRFVTSRDAGACDFFNSAND